ncbi:MAG: ATP-dependent DNA helicase RecG, partial [Oscillospiraceae bacterium]|nr:ATP-dependent DNA helicase RecG [Oscillospiraceae bacterium]
MNKQLKLPISSLSGVGKKRSMLYNKLGILDVQGLLYYFPRTYIDCTNPLNLSQTNLYEKCCVKATITKKEKPIIRQRKMSIYTAYAIDCNEQPLKIIFFNNPYALKDLIVGKEYLFFGKIGGNILLKEMIAPQIINLDSAGLIPQYPLTAGLTSKMIISNVTYALTLLDDEDSLPKYLIEKYNLISLKEALNNIHFPKTNDQLKKATDRLIFEELLCWQIGLCLIRSGRTDRTKEQLTNTDLSPLLKSLSFKLTKSQINVINECIADCLRSTPMNRLVQGDVGCGKTMIAIALS